MLLQGVRIQFVLSDLAHDRDVSHAESDLKCTGKI